MEHAVFTIASVERDTGLPKETLRVWERRYGFPAPERDDNGERLYPAPQLEKLRLIKRLMDQGFRPGRLMAAGDEELASMAGSADSRHEPAPSGSAGNHREASLPEEILTLIKAHEVDLLRKTLHQAMHRQGLQRFVMDTVVQLNQSVGEAWMRGDFAVFEEHLYTEQMQSLLRQAISALPVSTTPPRIVLTTAPDEQHILGLLMSEALLTLEGACCISLGTQTPLTDIAQAAEAHRADVVALSFSAAFPLRQVQPLLMQLRALLPEKIALWAGGAGTARLSEKPGMLVIKDLPTLLSALSAWRNELNQPGQTG